MLSGSATSSTSAIRAGDQNSAFHVWWHHGTIRPRWSIRKWYLDCVADDGAAWIGYWGDVRWGSLHVSFVSSLIHDGVQTTTTNRVRADAEPHRDEHAVRWTAPSLGVDFALTPSAREVEMELHDGVVWRCVAPCGDAIVRMPGTNLHGRGYAEVLEMTVAPWSLPMRELRWGRAIGERTSLVWIQWSGAKPLQIAVRDGALADAVHIGDDEVRLADGTCVTMSKQIVLREDSLANTLKPLRAIAPLLPRMLTGAIERKWRSRGTITTPDRPNDEGWVIHEHLTFAAD